MRFPVDLLAMLVPSVLAVASPALAQQRITLSPGSEIRIAPAVDTVVQCTGSNQPSDHFCRCSYSPRLGYYLERLVLVSGQYVSTTLSQHDSAADCSSALQSHPACR